MLLTVTSTADPADDLGYLLHKHPDRHQTFDLSVGTAHVFYPESTSGRCTAALLLDVDPIDLVRSRRSGNHIASALGQYVNDRPYAASSMLAVALGRVFRTAMTGRCDARPELVDQALPLEITVPVLPCAGGAEVARELFEPLGWTVTADPIPLDPEIPDWGDSRYVSLTLTGRVVLAQALRQLYVLLPVLDDAKHYWVSTDEVDKLVRAGEGWLVDHPAQELIMRRYLAHQRSMVDDAVSRLAEVDDTLPEQFAPDEESAPAHTQRIPLAGLRRDAVLQALSDVGAATVIDVGCGEGALLRVLLHDSRFRRVAGTDVSAVALRQAARRLQLDRMSERQRERVDLFQSSLTYRDDRLAGFDALVLMEVIEHVDPSRLPALVDVVFAAARPGAVIVTTPNAEHNVCFETLTGMRHPDHRFEWTRSEFRGWAEDVARGHGYEVAFRAVGGDDPEVGPPTQMAHFRRTEAL